MSINYIESISIDGLGNAPDRKLFNGYIYNLNYKIGVGLDKSEITVNIWSEDGTYSISKSDLGWTKLYKIHIGNNIVFNGYLVRYKIDKTTKKTLELKFTDTSCKMDKYYIGLKNKSWKSSVGNLIIVGREIHPCDRDYDGEIDSIPEMTDECHPCRNQATSDASIEKLNCKDMNYHQIFDVKYNFTMLLQELGKYFTIQSGVKDPNPKYFKSVTGTVRETLSNWCADFGWIFYWENDTIKFIDSRKTINIKSNIADYAPNLSSMSEEYSVENSFDRMVGTYYERPGTKDKYTCSDALYFQIPIFEPNRADLGAELQITSKIPHIAAGLVQYDEGLRDLWYWFDHYNLRKPENYFPGKKMHKVGMEILGSPIMLDGRDALMSASSIHLDTAGAITTSSLDQSTGLGKPDGMPANPDPSSSLDFLKSSAPTPGLSNVQAMIRANKKYRMCFELMKSEDQWVVANGLAKNPNDYFFFVAYYDQEIHQEHKKIEQDYGSNFLNKFHILVPDMSKPVEKKFFEDYTFKQDEVCGVKVRSNDNKISYNFASAGDGNSLEFFNTPSESTSGNIRNLSDLPFHQWLKIFRDSEGNPSNTPEQIQKLAEKRALMFRMIVVQKQDTFYPSPSTKASDETDEEGDEKPKDKIKNGKLLGLANKNSLIILEEKNNEIGEFVPRKLLEDTKYPLDKSIDRTKVYIVVGRAVSDTDYKIVSANAINPSASLATLFDGAPEKTKYRDEFDLKGEVFYKYKDLKCKEMGNLLPFCYRRSFKTPVATFTYYEPTYSNYGTVMEKTKEINYTFAKLEMPIWNKFKINDNVGNIQVIEKNISDEQIRIFKNTQNKCRYDIGKIKEYHKTMSSHLEMTQTSPIESLSFTIEGVNLTKAPKIHEGLVGIDISVDSEGGVSSTYSLATTLMRKIELETLIGTDEFTKQKSKTDFSNPSAHIPSKQ